MEIEAGTKFWYLYLIECSDGAIYTGITTDVQARYVAHCAGKGARYTRSNPPRRLLGVAPFPSRSHALKAEYVIKQMSTHQKRIFADTMLNPMEFDPPETSGID